MKNFSNITITCSGFEQAVKNELVEKIKKLGAKFDENLKKSTSYLISNKINTEKCLNAAKHDKKIMKKEWLDAVLKSKSGDVKEEKYYLGCFGGISIFLVGYRGEDEKIAEKEIIDNNGIIANSLNNAEIIVLKNNGIIKIEEERFFEKISHKIVTEKWLEDCIIEKKYIDLKEYLNDKIDFEDNVERLIEKYKQMKNDLVYNNNKLNKFRFDNNYSDNHISLNKNNKQKIEELKETNHKDSINQKKSDKRSSSNSHISLEEKKKPYKMDIDSEISQSSCHIFKNVIFYISNDYEKTTKQLIFKAISLGYGIIYDKISSFTTHIITQTNKDNFLNNAKFNKIKKPFIVNHHWVLDSLVKLSLLDCDDYMPISLLEIATKNEVKEDIYTNIRIVSYIFKHHTFSIIKESYSKEEYEFLTEKILSHGGEVIKYNNNLDDPDKLISKYILINDASDLLTDVVGKRDTSQTVISHRFIDKCIEQRTLLDLVTFQYIHLLPLSYRIPLSDFQKLSIYFYAIDRKERNILEHVVEILGANCDLSKKTTHIVCNKISDVQKENYRIKFNNNILFVSTEWMIECLINGCHFKEEKFLL